jgi:hypothetical protein
MHDDWFTKEASRAATSAHRLMMQAGYPLRLYLYYKPGDGGLRYFNDDEAVPEGWVLGNDTPLSGALTLEGAIHWTVERARRLPCLPLEPSDVLEILELKLRHHRTPEEAYAEMIADVDSPAARSIIAKTVWGPIALKTIRGYVLPSSFEVQNLDVWGNEREGWRVNGATMAGEVLLPWHATDKERLEMLKWAGHLDHGVRGNQVLFVAPSSDFEDGFEVYQRRGRKPLFTLRKIGR